MWRNAPSKEPSAVVSDARIDGLRGLAALMVVASHSSSLGLDLVPGLSLVGIGKYGVYLFFVISAYLLTSQWLQAGNWFHFLGPYLIRRVLRIYPLYIVVLLLGWALAPRGLGITLTGSDVLDHLLLQAGFNIYWSIPVEFSYYLVIPLFALLWSSGLATSAKWAITLAAQGWVLLHYPSSQASTNSIELGYYSLLFTAGSLLAIMMIRKARNGQLPGCKPISTGAKPAPRAWSMPDALIAACLILTIPAVIHAFRPEAESEILHRTFLVWATLWGLMLWGLINGHLPMWQRLLETSFLRVCGRWCFSLYLLHMPCLFVANKLIPYSWLAAWAGLALSVLVAGLAFTIVEQPFIRLGARLGKESFAQARAE